MAVALIFAPLAMIGGHAAMAAPAKAVAGAHHSSEGGSAHCANMGDEEPGDPRASIDCTIACAALLPSIPAVATALAAVKSPDVSTIIVAQHGLSPAAEPRPPRVS